MQKTILSAIFIFHLPAMAAVMVAPPPGGSTTIFELPGNAWNVTQALVLGQFTINGNPSYAYCANSEYGLGWSASSWSPSTAPFAYITPNGATTTVTINLGGSYTRAGGFVAYERYTTPTIEALDANMNVLESYSLATAAPINASGTNNGAFRGIEYTAASIHYFRLTGKILMHSITIDGGSIDPPGGGGGPLSDVPEPAPLGCMLLGAAMIAARRRQAAGLPRQRPI